MTNSPRSGLLRACLLAAALMGSLLSAPSSLAQNATPTDEAALIARIKAEIMKEIRESDFMKEAVKQGIQEYITEQRETRAKAQADRQRQASARAKNVRPVSAERDHIFGNPEAPISLIEYSDFECPYCKRFHPTAKKLVEESNGQVNWVYRHYPLSFHNPGAQKQAEASECAAELGGNEMFWKFTDAIYERTRAGGKGFALSKLTPLAVELGLDEAAFKECLDSGRHEARVKEDFDEGQSIGITGTPGNIVRNNETGEVQVRSGAQPLQAFQSAVKTLMTETASATQ